MLHLSPDVSIFRQKQKFGAGKSPYVNNDAYMLNMTHGWCTFYICCAHTNCLWNNVNTKSLFCWKVVKVFMKIKEDRYLTLPLIFKSVFTHNLSFPACKVCLSKHPADTLRQFNLENPIMYGNVKTFSRHWTTLSLTEKFQKMPKIFQFAWGL